MSEVSLQGASTLNATSTSGPLSFVIFTGTDATLHICTPPLKITLQPVLLRSSAPEGSMLETRHGPEGSFNSHQSDKGSYPAGKPLLVLNQSAEHVPLSAYGGNPHLAKARRS
jgi:hypothetical protein